MREINGWNSLDANSETVEFLNLKPGAYRCKILEVRDDVQKECLVIKFDIAEKNEYERYFGSKYMLDSNWPNQATLYKSYKESASKFFRAFITAIEKSNSHKNWRWDWDEKKLVGCFFVAVFGEEEYLDKEGNVKVSVKCQEVRSLQAFNEGKIAIPELKKLKNRPVENTAVNSSVQFEVNEDDLPF